jgi:hypothetical protein
LDDELHAVVVIDAAHIPVATATTNPRCTIFMESPSCPGKARRASVSEAPDAERIRAG